MGDKGVRGRMVIKYTLNTENAQKLVFVNTAIDLRFQYGGEFSD